MCVSTYTHIVLDMQKNVFNSKALTINTVSVVGFLVFASFFNTPAN